MVNHQKEESSGGLVHNLGLGTCGRKRPFWGLFSAPRAPSWPLQPFSGFSRQAFQGCELPQLTFSTSFLTTPSLPHFFRGAYFGSLNSLPKWASLQSTCGSWLAVYMGSSSQPVFALASLVVLPLLSSALSHECTTITNPPCVSSSTLDRPCVPRRDIGETGEISKGWLASAEPET